MKDTDSDWKAIAADEPYFGVLSQPEFLRENLNAATLDRFWASGHQDIAWQVELLRSHFGAFQPATSLDFGCGVGRLSRAMATIAKHVYAVDVAPAMLAEARRGAPDTIEFSDQIPSIGMDWINSLIVFQHIPPRRGIVILCDLLAILNPGGAVTLHFTIGREIGTATMRDSGVETFRWDGSVFYPLISAPPPVGGMMMYDYDLGQVISAFHKYGVGRVLLQHINHGGYHGVIVIGRRN